MTKAELTAVIAENAEITRAEAERTIKALLDTVTECLKKGDKLNLVGFGTFSTAKRAARKGKNPLTGKQINIPARITPKFKAGKTLKEAVNTKSK